MLRRRSDLPCGGSDVLFALDADVFGSLRFSVARGVERAIESGVDLSLVDLSGFDLSGSCLRGARLVEARLSGARLVGADLSSADLSFANLSEADLSGATLDRSLLPNASFDRARMGGASLVGVDLHGAEMCGADLREASLDGACMRYARLRGARLGSARLRGALLIDADLRDAVLGDAILTDAVVSSSTALSAGIADAGVEATDVFVVWRGIHAEPDVDLATRYRLRNPDVPVVDWIDRRLRDELQSGRGFLDAAGIRHGIRRDPRGSRHDRAGWAVHLAGDAGIGLEEEWGTEVAAGMIYRASAGFVPNFQAEGGWTMSDILRCASVAAFS